MNWDRGFKRLTLLISVVVSLISLPIWIDIWYESFFGHFICLYALFCVSAVCFTVFVF